MSAATIWRWTKGLGRALVLVLAGFVGKAIPPRAGGEPYVKER